jgi:hypothetical protein
MSTDHTDSATHPSHAVTPATSGLSVAGDGAQPRAPLAWQVDPAVQEIHNAFRLGWSLVELRSRVQIAALDDQKLPTAAFTTAGEATATPDTSDPMGFVKGANNALRRASQMRTIFNSIVTLQRTMFPTIANVSRLYDPPAPDDLPYLYPELHPDPPPYMDFGIGPPGPDETDAQEIWPGFRLYDVTRRAVNGLVLLLSDPQDNLVPGKIAEQQRRFLDEILSATEQETAHEAPVEVSAGFDAIYSDAAATSLTATAIQACDSYKKSAPPEEKQLAARSKHGDAITALTFLTARLLQAWDGFLRERFASAGVGDRNPHALLAYEAGRNMATISWTTSVNAVRLENEGGDGADISAQLYQVWQDRFTDSQLVQVLHQITALSAIFDDVYYRGREKPAALTTDNPLDDLLVRPDPSLPSQVLQAVKQSIEYWQRTVLWMDTSEGSNETGPQAVPRPAMTVDDWKHMRQALIEQSGIWFNLMTGQQDLRGFTVEGIAQGIMDEAISDLRGLAQRDLPAAFRQASEQLDAMARDVADFIVAISGTATRAAKEGIDRLFDTLHPILWGIIGLSGVLVVALIVYALSTGQTDALIGAVTSVGTAVAGLFGIRRGTESRDRSQENVTETIEAEKNAKTEQMKSTKREMESTLAQARSGLAGAAGTFLGQTGDFLVRAYENGLRRIQIELQSLNYSIAVAHPLVEFFVRHSAVESDLEFLTKVIWDKTSREAQLRNVVSAAFGPISILLGAPAEDAASVQD